MNGAIEPREALQRAWLVNGQVLHRLLSGEVKMTISMSQPDAGSDAGAMRTTARCESDHWAISGRKLWATGAGAQGNLINGYVKTDSKAHYRRGMSLFLVDNDAPGLKWRTLDMLGLRCVGMPQGHMMSANIS